MTAPSRTRTSEASVARATTLGVLILAAHTALGLARLHAYANETFDVAFYTRIAWGLAHGDLYQPMLSAHVFGLRISPILWPLGLLGRWVGTAEALYLAPGLACALAVPPLVRFGRERLGETGALAAALAFTLHPNLGHVLSYEVHPGTMALLPLTYLGLAIANGDGRTFFVATLGVLLCREDTLLIPLVAAPLVAWKHPASRRGVGAAVAVAFTWLGLFLAVLHARFRPPSGSLEAHFGAWGGSLGEVARTLVREPMRLVRHLLAWKRVTYLPRVLGPLALLPVLAPRWFVPAAPVLGVCLISHFVTTTRIDSHYFTDALPFLVLGALEGGAVLARRVAGRVAGERDGAIAIAPRWQHRVALLLVASSVVSYLAVGRVGAARGFRVGFHELAPRAETTALLAQIPPHASVEAPDALLPHLAERRVLHRRKGFAGDDEAIVVDLSHRERFAGTDTLLRTTEEPWVRSLLGRRDRKVAAVAGPYVLFLRVAPGSSDPFGRYRLPSSSVDDAPTPLVPDTRLTACLGVIDARRLPGTLDVELRLRAHGTCPDDLALRMRAGAASRVDLLFDGLASPARLVDGDLVRSRHRALPGERIEVGALRSSGARPAPEDPPWIPVTVH